jgi:LacI family transcriptional regulator
LSLFTCTRGEESMRQFATQVSSHAFDGLLVIEPEGTLDYITELHGRGLPVVLIDDRGHQPISTEGDFTFECGRVAVQRLISASRWHRTPRPPLTTVHQPMRRMGATSAQLLIGHFEGRRWCRRPP